MTPRNAAAINDGWINVPHPAAAPGWYHVTRARHAPDGFSEFVCGRGVPYVTPSRSELQWSPHRPAQGES